MARLCDSVEEEKAALSPHPPMIYDGTNALEEEQEGVEHTASAAVDFAGVKVLKTAIAIAVSVIVLL